jgi:hypothetical protein
MRSLQRHALLQQNHKLTIVNVAALFRLEFSRFYPEMIHQKLAIAYAILRGKFPCSYFAITINYCKFYIIHVWHE